MRNILDKPKTMNKRGQSGTVALWVLVALAVVGVIYFFATSQTGFGSDGGTTDPALCSEPTTTMTFPAVNALKQGTTVSTTVQASIDGATPISVGNATSFTVGDTVELLHTAGNFIDLKLDAFTVTCGLAQAPTANVLATGTNTFRIFNTNNQLVTDAAAGGATNQSSSASPINMDIRVDGTVDESTGDLIVVIEATNTTQVDNIVLSGLGGASSVAVPEFYSATAAGSIVKAFSVPEVLDGASVSGTLTVSPESGQTIDATSVYVTAYSQEWFVDVDGEFVYGVEDSDGTIQYEDTWDYDFLIT